MRAFVLLLVLSLGSSVAYAKGGPNPLLAAGSPGAARCNEIAAIAKKISANSNAVRGRPSRRMAMDAMRCAIAEVKAQEIKEAELRPVFQKFLDIFR